MKPFALMVKIKPVGGTRSYVSEEDFRTMAEANMRQLAYQMRRVGMLPSVSCELIQSDAATIEFDHNLPRGSFEKFVNEQQESEARGVGIEGGQ